MTSKALKTSAVAIIALFHLPYVQANYIETFDRSDLPSTHLSRLFTSGSGTFEISPLESDMYAPDASYLPISTKGDNELRYYKGGATHSYAVTPETSDYIFSDVSVASMLSLGTTGGSRTAAVMARVNGNSLALSGYTAYITNSGDNKVYFKLAYMIDGTVHTNYFLAYGGIFTYDPYNENFHITLTTHGDLITATLSKADRFGLPHLSTISATNNMFSSGVTGIWAFARSPSNIFFDDVSATIIPEPMTVLLLGFGGMMLRKQWKN